MDKDSPTPSAAPSSPELELPATAPEPVATPPEPEKTAEPDTNQPTDPIPPKPGMFRRFSGWPKSHKKLSILLAVLVVLAIIFAIPSSRYQAAGLVLKQNITVKVMDSTTNDPVSGVTVSSGGVSAQTDGNGQATLRLKDGHHLVSVSKTYYDSANLNVLAPILKPKTISSVSLQATGRQVKVTITNLISGQAVAGANISVAGVQAKTDNSGNASVVVPAGATTQSATLSLSGYNNATVKIQVSNSEIAQNNFTMTPSGKVYYLSDASGKLDVVGSNLDGTGTKTVLAGSGDEDTQNTTLAVSSDNDYIALLAKRTADTNPQLYIINTNTGTTTEIDHGNANFQVNGWLGDYLIYNVSSNAVNSWQAGRNKLNSYNAASGQTVLLSQSSATGNSTAAADEVYEFIALSGSTVVYSKNWEIDYSLSDTPNLSAQKNSLNSINVNGSSSQIVASYAATGQTSYNQYSPIGIYIDQEHEATDKYYNYQIGGGAPTTMSFTQDQFDKIYPYYYISPNGQKSFWSETRDGKNTLFVGDKLGANGKVIANLSDYSDYGWYNDQYLLVSKSSSELYVMSTSGRTPVKIGDYQSGSSSGIGLYGGGGGGY